MIKRFKALTTAFVLASALAALGAVPALTLSQGRVGFSDRVDVSAGRALGLRNSVSFFNEVTFEFRHCQKYVKTTGFWFWRKSVVDQEACNADPSTLYHTETRKNLVTDAGFDFISSALSNTAAQPASCNYIALASDSSNGGVGTVAVTDTTIASSGTGSTEIAANGLSRAIGTYAHTGGTKVYTVSKVFTATGTQASNKTGLFNAAAAGTMCYEVLYTAVTVNNNDTLTVTWTVTLS